MLLLWAWPAAAASAQPTPGLGAATNQRLDAAIEQAMKTTGVPGVIVGIWAPGGSYVRAFGIADKATGAPMRTDFYSRIGSVTKTFTITGVLQLADQGRLGLDDPIARYVDGVPRGDEITLRELARMQSGLYNYTATDAFHKALVADPRRYYAPQELLDMAFAQPEVFGPGQGFQYSNTNTILLGLVVEEVSGQSLPDYI
ncbi:MAG: beta-lactamase family protein, partial [Mycobacteriaceae bacterium]|nr:beta-lactamase family protein [Mycobacteriaceae bacterium]